MEKLKDRVEMRMQKLGLNANQLAKAMGHSGNGTVWSLLSGRTQTFRDMDGLAKALKTTPDWLLTGKGSPSVADLPARYDNHEFRSILTECYAVWKDGYSHIPAKTVLEIAEAIYDQIKGEPEAARRKQIKTALTMEERRASNSAT